MELIDRFASIMNRIAELALSIQKKLSIFLAVGVIASGSVIWQWSTLSFPFWWKALISAPFIVPLLVWIVIWYVLNQLRDAPALVSELVSDDDGVFANLSELSLSEPSGFRSLASTIREFREQDGLEVIFDTFSGVGLLASPIFLVFAILMFFGLLGTILVAPFIIFIF